MLAQLEPRARNKCALDLPTLLYTGIAHVRRSLRCSTPADVRIHRRWQCWQQQQQQQQPPNKLTSSCRPQRRQQGSGRGPRASHRKGRTGVRDKGQRGAVVISSFCGESGTVGQPAQPCPGAFLSGGTVHAWYAGRGDGRAAGEWVGMLSEVVADCQVDGGMLAEAMAGQ
eukprot:1139993-Pelagomonas_calceolata.AAC.2